MSDYLTRLAERALGLTEGVQPRLPGWYAEPVASAGAPTAEPSAIDGVYRYDVPRELFLERGLVENLDEDAPGRPAAAHAIATLTGPCITVRVLGNDPARYQFAL